MTKKPLRSTIWLGLLTFFLVIPLLAMWLGWQASIVRERKALIAEGKARGIWAGEGSGTGAAEEESLSWSIRITMGDRKYRLILLTDEYSVEEFDRFERAFPESVVVHKFTDKYIHRKPLGDKYRIDNSYDDAGTDE